MRGFSLTRTGTMKAFHISIDHYFVSLLVVVGICSIEPQKQNLTTISRQSEIEAYRFTEHHERCKWYDVRGAIESLDSNNMSAMVHTSCMSTDSLGNDISQYVEARLCAKAAGLHFISSPKTFSPITANDVFYKAFPSVVLHPNPEPHSPTLKDRVLKLCPCQGMCHEWRHGLMHSNMPTVGSIFREAITAYWNTVSSAKKNIDLKLGNVRVGSGGTDITADMSTILPIIPDVAIHYRCGDNVVTHYGFTPFRVFKNTIPPHAKHIYVMAENPGRKTKSHHLARCDAIFQALFSYLMSHFPRAIVVILRGHDILDDLARLTFAPLTICSVSTFCLWPAVASNTSAYFPVTRLIAKEDVSFDYGKAFHWLADPRDRAFSGVKAVHMSNHDVVKKLVGS